MAQQFLFLFFLSILCVCSSGIFLSPAIKQKELERREQQTFHSLHRGLLYKAIRHDFTDAPATFPTTPVTNPVTTPVTNPVTTPAVNAPPANSAPDIVTVPSANPITVAPAPPFTNPVPVPVPNTGPVNGGIPITNPVTTPSTNSGGQPASNPVTTYPTPTGGVPVTAPVTNPVAPPTTTSPTTSAPAVPGQSWCVVKNGVPETTLQSALDYACGIGGADCSAIQQGASCYNPNSLQYHASFAFNSYYQKNPAQTSCDFGGTAVLTNVNPSTGSCIFPTSASSTSSSSTTSPITATPMPTTASSSGAGPGSISPSVLNTSNPGYGGTATGFGESPASTNASTSMSSCLQPFIGCIIAVTSIITGRFVFDI
ncbi:mucin-2-like [Forsythia ovata]|uniref:Mucin-2-like n=1 Tax=Forsythia ovata TaxID=205694 RepID=A0ABD1QPT8_9LAMI